MIPANADLLTISAAAELLGVSVKTIRRRIADGSLKGYRFGPRLIRVDIRELERLLRPVGGAAWSTPSVAQAAPAVAQTLMLSTDPRRIGKGGLTGFKPGSSGVTLLEHELRDDLARKLNGCTEAVLPYGRADVATETHVIEVEPFKSWQHGIRQALAYAQQCTLLPGLALFGDASADQVLDLHLRLRESNRTHPGPYVGLWWHTGTGWLEITSPRHARRMRMPRSRRSSARGADDTERVTP